MLNQSFVPTAGAVKARSRLAFGKRARGLGIAALVAANFGIAATAMASTVLPAPTGSVFGEIWGQQERNESIVSLSNPWTSVFGSISYNPAPAVLATVDNMTSPEGWVANSYFSYSFSADGAVDQLVPVSIRFILDTSATGSESTGIAGISMQKTHEDTEIDQFNYVACSATTNGCDLNGYGGDPSHLSGVWSGYIQSNTAYTFDLSAIAFANSRDGFPSVAFAFADPQITIEDPNFHLNLPDFIGNRLPGGAPEPGTWAMMLVGFGGLGAVLRRKHRVALAA
jgi:hypothetical protein